MLRRSSKSTLLARLEAAGQLRGLSRADVLARLGKPQSSKEYPDGTFWALWQDPSDYVALFFDADDQCLGILREIIDRGVHDGAVFEADGTPSRLLPPPPPPSPPSPLPSPLTARPPAPPPPAPPPSPAPPTSVPSPPFVAQGRESADVSTPQAPPPAPLNAGTVAASSPEDDGGFELVQFCPACALPVPPDALSCSACGTPLAISAEPPSPEAAVPPDAESGAPDRVDRLEMPNDPPESSAAALVVSPAPDAVPAEATAVDVGDVGTTAWTSCPRCGRRVRPDASECAGCGRALGGDDATPDGEASPETLETPETPGTPRVDKAARRKRVRLSLAVAAAVFVLAAAAVGLSVAHRSQNPSGAAAGSLNTPATTLCAGLLPIAEAQALSGDAKMSVRSFAPNQPGLPVVSTADCQYAGAGGTGTIVTLLVWQNAPEAVHVYADLAAGYPGFTRKAKSLTGVGLQASTLPGLVVVQAAAHDVVELSAAASDAALVAEAGRIVGRLGGIAAPTTSTTAATTTTTAPTTTTSVPLSPSQSRFVAAALRTVSFVATDLAALEKSHTGGRSTLAAYAESICASYVSAGPAATQVPRPIAAAGRLGWSGLYTVWVHRIAHGQSPPARLNVAASESWVSLAIIDLCPGYRADIPPGFPGGPAVPTTTTTVTRTTIRVPTTTTTIGRATTTTQAGLGGGGGIG